MEKAEMEEKEFQKLVRKEIKKIYQMMDELTNIVIETNEDIIGISEDMIKLLQEKDIIKI